MLCFRYHPSLSSSYLLNDAKYHETNDRQLWPAYPCKKLSMAHLFSKPKQGSNQWLFPKGGMGASLMNSRDVGYLRKAIRGMHYLETFPATKPASHGLMTEKAQEVLSLKCGRHQWNISALSSWKPWIVIKKRMCPHWGCVDGSHPEHQRWFPGYSDVRCIWVWWRGFWV